MSSDEIEESDYLDDFLEDDGVFPCIPAILIFFLGSKPCTGISSSSSICFLGASSSSSEELSDRNDYDCLLEWERFGASCFFDPSSASS